MNFSDISEIEEICSTYLRKQAQSPVFHTFVTILSQPINIYISPSSLVYFWVTTNLFSSNLAYTVSLCNIGSFTILDLSLAI